MSDTLAVNDSTFKTEIGGHNGVALVDFWNEGCPPCRILAPIIDELAVEFAGKVKITKCCAADAYETVGDLGLRAVPTLVLFKNGQEIDRIVGARSKAQLKSWLLGAI